MTIDVDAVYEDGVLKPDRPLALKDKAKVHVTIEAKTDDTSPATGWKAAREFIGMWKDAPARSSTALSEDHDQALYRRK
jgi:predicted DNA-binding antitoxin AbrB/MazE fold protein